MRVLLTRPVHESRRSAAHLRKLGHDVLIAPVFQIVRTEAAPPEGDFDMIVATSAHAFADTRLFKREWTDIPVHVVGERTARAVSRTEFRAPHTIARDAEDLTRRLIAQAPTPARILYVAGRDRTPALEAALRGAGHTVIPWIVYEARPVATLTQEACRALTDGDVEAILHFSARSAELFLDLAAKSNVMASAMAPLQIAISTRTAQALRPFASRLIIAPTPDIAGMIAALD